MWCFFAQLKACQCSIIGVLLCLACRCVTTAWLCWELLGGVTAQQVTSSAARPAFRCVGLMACVCILSTHSPENHNGPGFLLVNGCPALHPSVPATLVAGD